MASETQPHPNPTPLPPATHLDLPALGGTEAKPKKDQLTANTPVAHSGLTTCTLNSSCTVQIVAGL